MARSIHRHGEQMRVCVPDGEVVGEFVGFGPEGQLLVATGQRDAVDGGRRARHAGAGLGGSIVLLALDVGNTHTTIGVFRENEILRRWRLSTTRERTVDELGILLSNLCQWSQISPDDIGGVIVGSVVPPIDGALKAAIATYLHAEALFVAPGIRSGMPLKVETPQELGADRLCNAVAAFAVHGGPCVVVDFGTATTWEVVSEKGEFLGGVIAPGLEISAEALFSRAAKLPRIELVPPARVIGKATVDSIQAGLVYGYVGLVEGVTRRVLAELGGGQGHRHGRSCPGDRPPHLAVRRRRRRPDPQGAAPPVGAQPARSRMNPEELEYYRAVEDLFARLRGTPFLFSPKDFALLRRWWSEGVPLAAVAAGLGEVFARRAEADGNPGLLALVLPTRGGEAREATGDGLGRGGPDRWLGGPQTSRGAIDAPGRGAAPGGGAVERHGRRRRRAPRRASLGRDATRRGRPGRGRRDPGAVWR